MVEIQEIDEIMFNIPCWEVDSEGNIIEHYLWSDVEIEEALSNGRNIITQSWTNSFYQPKYDFVLEDWIEGKVDTEILEDIKQRKVEELKSICNSEIIGGFQATNGHFYEFEEHDQNNFTQQMLLLVSNPALTDIQWKTVDVGVIIHSRQEFSQIVTDAQNHKQGNISKYWQLKGLVEIATTIEEINNIVW